MAKIIRNTVFTLLILVLTAVGLSWNRQVSQNEPESVAQTILSTAEATNAPAQPFPLKVSYDKPHLKLGQYQELIVATVPNINIEIVTAYPSGSINNPQTFPATTDATGRYSLKFKMDDPNFLGVFTTTVTAIYGDQRAEATARYALQTWIGSDTAIGNDSTSYVYPLLP